MVKRYRIYWFYPILSLVLFIYISSCTYDYFEDESNYIVYVPKADENNMIENYLIEDLAIYIYNNDLQTERYSYMPFNETPRTRIGDFHFKLFPGSFNVYSFTNLSNITFSDLNSHNSSRFELQKNTDGYYLEPSAIHLEYSTPIIHSPGPVVIDTARFEAPFTGRICIAFKNTKVLSPSLTADKISLVEIEAGGIGVVQYFAKITDSIETRSSRYTNQDKMLLKSNIYSNPYKDFEFGLENNYLPSPDLGLSEPINLQLKFLDDQNAILYTLFVDLINSSNNPIILHANETVVIEIDGDKVHIISLDNPADWGSIEDGGGNVPGGGIEV